MPLALVTTLAALNPPPVVVVVAGTVEKLMVCPAPTGLPCTSSTATVRLVLPPGLTVAGWAFRPMAAGVPGTNVIATEAENPAVFTVTAAFPVLVGAIRNNCATPLASVMAEVAAVAGGAEVDRVPAVAAKATATPGTPAPAVSLTVARMAA